MSGAWWGALPPRLTLDLELRDENRGIHLEVPVLPTSTSISACHLHASNQGASWSGRLRDDGASARAAVMIFDWFKTEDLRGCALTE